MIEKMNLLGIGMISAYGLGIHRFQDALADPEIVRQTLQQEDRPAFRVRLDAIPNKSLLKKIRRAGRLSKMTVLAAQDALVDATFEPSRLGLILATSLGPHPTTFAFLDDIIQYGEGNVSPTVFSNSVHNAPAGYVAETLGIRGPTLTVTRFFHAFHEALRMAGCWLAEKRCDRVLVGAADEHGEVLQYVLDTLLPDRKNGASDSLNPGVAHVIPGEGAVFFLLGPSGEGAGLCLIHSVFRASDETEFPDHDIRIIEPDGLVPNQASYYPPPSNAWPLVASYTHAYGSMLTGSAFGAAAGALMLQRQCVYTGAQQGLPGHGQTVEGTGRGSLRGIITERVNCNGEKMVIYMTRDDRQGTS